MLVVAIAMFASLTVLPAMLAWLGDRVEKGRVPFLGAPARPAGQSRFWAAIDGARHARGPVWSLVLAGGLLIALAIPALRHEGGRHAASTSCPGPADHQDLQQGQEGVPERGRDGDGRRPGRQRALRRGRSRASPRWPPRSTGVRSFPPAPTVTYSEDDTVAKIEVPTAGNGTDTRR